VNLPKHCSAAQLSTYAACPKKYELCYLEHADQEFTSVGLALGGVVHAAVEWFFDRKVEGHDPSVDDALQILRADFAAALDTEIRLGKWTPKDLEEHARRLVRHLLENIGDLPVRASEVRFEMALYDAETGEVLPRPFIGFFDLLLDGGNVVELKTARSEYTPIQVATNLQIGGYLVALEQLDLGDTLDLVVVVKNRKPRLQKLRLKPTPQSEDWFLSAATRIERSIQARHFPPSPGWSCGSCEYQRRCLGRAAEKAS